MSGQIRFPEQGNTQLDKKIKKTLNGEFPLPDNVEDAKQQAFARIREMQTEEERHKEQRNSQKHGKKPGRKVGRTLAKVCAGCVAAAAAFSGVCIVNPAFAAQIPLVGHVFEKIGDSLGFSGDYSKYAKPLEEDAVEVLEESGKEITDSEMQTGDTLYSKTSNGLNITLSEVYCNDKALYLSMVLKAENGFPENMMKWQQEETPIIELMMGDCSFDYNENAFLGNRIGLDGKMIDDHTFAGVIRYDLSETTDTTDYELFQEKYMEYLESVGISREEFEEDYFGTMDKLAGILGMDPDKMTDLDIQKAGNLEQYLTKAEIPEQFNLKLHFDGIYGYKEGDSRPEMPEEIQAVYEQKMADAGLDTDESAYENFTEEQKEQELKFREEMYAAYYEKYPELNKIPNRYENWSMEGSWDFDIDVTKDESQTIVKEFDDVDDTGLGLVSVTKTPFEIEVLDGMGVDYCTAVLDANGEPMDSGKFGGRTSVVAIGDHDVSKIYVYICDYYEYMDELKGYYWSEDYEEKKAQKSYQQLLEEHALYQKEIVF